MNVEDKKFANFLLTIGDKIAQARGVNQEAHNP